MQNFPICGGDPRHWPVQSYCLIATGEQFRSCVQEAFATITGYEI
jgi:hypothetical protein